MHCVYLTLPLFKVLWRYKGKKPEALGSNTRIYDWIPQNDLLGEPDSISDHCALGKTASSCFSTKIATFVSQQMQPATALSHMTFPPCSRPPLGKGLPYSRWDQRDLRSDLPWDTHGWDSHVC